jgi:flagellin FlaB
MKKHKRVVLNDMGAIGIGAMIVFIAMVLVAGIAASVLIQTSTRLESQAMSTGEETTAEVATGLAVEDIKGYAASSEDLKYLAIEIRSRAGSQEVDLSNAFIELSDSNIKIIMTYNSSLFTNNSDIDGNLFTSTFYDGLDSNQFSVVVLEDADGSLSSSTPVINRGDSVVLTINVGDADGFNQISERTDVWGMVVPEEGSPGIIAFRTPASFTDNVFDLQ